jgi:hypothetical protein
MPQRPWAIGNLIVHDETNLRSTLVGGDGLPSARAWLSQRHGYWPRMSGLSRQGYRMSMETYLLHSTEAERLAARTALLQALNPEMEEPVRFTAVDYVLEDIGRDGVMLAMGPWDVYCDDDGSWHVRDLLQPDDLEADLSGGWQIGQDGGLQIAEETTNLPTNPSFETNTTGWATGGTNTITRSSEQAKFGSYSLKCTYQDTAALAYDSITLTAAAHSLSAWLFIPADYDGASVRVLFSGFASAVGTAAVAADMNIRDQWQRVEVPNYTPDAGDLNGLIAVDAPSAPTAGKYIYLDAVQCEAKAYCTPYCDGSLGPGHSWSGTAHDSTSSRTAAECELDDYAADLVSDQMTIAFWFIPGVLASDVGNDIYLFEAYGGDNDNRVMIWFDDNSDEIRLYVNGGFRCTVDPSSINVGDAVFIVATLDFDEDEWNLYVFEDDGTLGTDSDNTALSIPTFTAMSIGSSDGGAAQANGVIDRFMILDHVMTQAEAIAWREMGRDGINARRLDILCEAAVPWAPGGVPSLDRGLVSTLAVDGDVRWRQRDGDVRFWRVYDDSWDITVDVGSDDDVWPEFRITPRTAKTTGFAYRQWHAIKWASDNEATDYPVMLGPTDYTGKAQGDGDDIRVYVDGEEVDRWLGGTLINNVKVWVNLDFEPDISLTLAEAIAAAGAVDYIQFAEDISDLPVEGIIYVDTEAFYYTDKNNRTKKVSGITRATRGTAAAGHAASTAAYWIQHDVWVYYDDATLAAPVVDGDYEPAFDLDNSTNASHVYTEFGEDDGLRTLQWSGDAASGSTHTSEFYTANHHAFADPWEELGMYVNPGGSNVTSWALMELYNPCGIAGVSCTNGEFYIHQDGTYSSKYCKLQACDDNSSWADEQTYNLPNTFTAWTPADDLIDAAVNHDYIRLYTLTTRTAAISPDYTCVEYADVTITVEAPPVVAAAAEQESYNLVCTIANAATGEEIAITAGMILDQTLVVNTDEKSAILDDGMRLATAIVTDTVRRDWLRLIPGENPLTFEDTGTQELEIDILWDRRLFE